MYEHCKWLFTNYDYYCFQYLISNLLNISIIIRGPNTNDRISTSCHDTFSYQKKNIPYSKTYFSSFRELSVLTEKKKDRVRYFFLLRNQFQIIRSLHYNGKIYDESLDEKKKKKKHHHTDTNYSSDDIYPEYFIIVPIYESYRRWSHKNYRVQRFNVKIIF